MASKTHSCVNCGLNSIVKPSIEDKRAKKYKIIIEKLESKL